jgi:hypothetical protein
MRIKFNDLWRLDGLIAPGTYALIGLIGFAIKHNLDRFVATILFHRPWSPFNYLAPVWDVARITDLRASDAKFLATMVAISLPFIWVGVTLTLKRLRSARLPLLLVVLFFVPVLNLLFFILLSVFPERSSIEQGVSPAADSWFLRVIPESRTGSAAFSLLLTVPVGLGLDQIGVHLLNRYGWGLFVAVPFAMGLGAALIYGLRAPRRLWDCVGVACLSVTILGLLLLGLAVEGLFCLLMAMPLALPLAAFGGACGYFMRRRHWLNERAPVFLCILLCFVPSAQWLEQKAAARPEVFVVRSSIDIHASPEVVWKQVVAFTEIGPPTEWMFRAGVAYPMRAEMVGTGVGAERHCVFSTGAFVEPIEVWDEPHRLKFSVSSNPSPLNEWTPYGHIETPHLHGYLVSQGGQFLLTPLPDGGTRLEGTTWYQHGLRPSSYWRLWSDAIIHQIHMRVLRHIRDEAEKDPPS